MSNRRKIKAKKKSRVSIVGTGPGCTLAPREGEVWVTNAHGMAMPHCTMAWDMHDFRWTFEENLESYGHLRHILSEEEIYHRTEQREARFTEIAEWSNMTGMPVMSVARYSWMPHSIAYPLDKVVRWAGTDYFTSTMAYMLAYAIRAGYRQIDMYGVNVEHAEEWAYQRDCITGWLMYGRGKGRKMTVNGTNLRPLRAVDGILYGYNRKQASPKGRWYIQKVLDKRDGEITDVHIFKEV